jgi:WD40 repeat protein
LDLTTGEDRLATPDAHQGDIMTLAWLPGGKTLVSGSRDRTARIWDLRTGRPMGMLAHGGWVVASADGSLLVTGSSYPELGTIRVWKTATGELLRQWPVADPEPGLPLPRGMTLSEDGASVIVALSDGSLRRWDVATGQERTVARPKLEGFPVLGPAAAQGANKVDVKRAIFARDARSAAMIGDEWVQVIDVASGEGRFKVPMASFLGACAFAPGGGSLAIVQDVRTRKFQAGAWSGSEPVVNKVVWLDGQSGGVRREIEIHDSYVRSLSFSPDGQDLAIGAQLVHPERGIIRIFRLRDKREVRTIASPCPSVETLSFSTDGERIAAGMSDTSIVVWDVRRADDRW